MQWGMAVLCVGDQGGSAGGARTGGGAPLSYEGRRKQATAIVMMGVIGAEFGTAVKVEGEEGRNIADGFNLTNYTHSRNTSESGGLMFMVGGLEHTSLEPLLKHASHV